MALLRPPSRALASVLVVAVLAGCTAVSPEPDAPDLEVGTAPGHEHTGVSSYPPCTYTLAVGPDAGMYAAMAAADPPENTTVEKRAPSTGVHIGLRHEGGTVEDVQLRYAYYRVFGEGRAVLRGVTVYGTDPITVGATGAWPDQDAVPREMQDPLVIALGAGGATAARVLWQAWREASAQGEERAAISYRDSHRLSAAWGDLFGDKEMPPSRPERVYIANGEATMEEGPWVWGVTAPYETWTQGNRTVHADAYGRYTATLVGAHPKTVIESHFLSLGLHVPAKMFVSLQPAC